MQLSPQSINALSALAVGFAFAGLIASSFELLLRRPLGFGALESGDLRAVLSVPFLVFSAPLLIVRNTVRGQRVERRPIPYVMVATVIACGWSILCGRLVLDVTAMFGAA